MTHATAPHPPRLTDLSVLARGVLAGDRAVLARAITLVESRKPEHRRLAGELIDRLLPSTGRAQRIGITGVPGAGKSTLIDALGTRLTGKGHRVAVLAVDPSSARSGGSILGDKTRMARLVADRNAFIRPSPAAGTLGGVAARTRETMLLCEAAGFDVVIVETMGIGQSEAAVADMVDVFVFLALPGAGDDLQGLKKGVLEHADVIAVNKAEGENAARAAKAAADYRSALNILGFREKAWVPAVVTVSGLADLGLDTLWDEVEARRTRLEASGLLAARRCEQEVRWMWAMLEERLRSALVTRREFAPRLSELEAQVRAGKTSATAAVEEIAAALGI